MDNLGGYVMEEQGKKQAQEVGEPEVTPIKEELEEQQELDSYVDKFSGKEKEEVIKAYKEAEKLIGKKEADLKRMQGEYESRIEELNSKLIQINSRPQVVREEIEPSREKLEDMDSKFIEMLASNPASAIKEYVDYKTKSANKKLETLAYEQHVNNIRSQEDYPLVADTMNQLIKSNSDLISPDRVTDPRVAAFLYYAARGLNVEKLRDSSSRSQESIKKEVNKEKKAVASESTSSSSSSSDITEEELLKLVESGKITPKKAEELIKKYKL